MTESAAANQELTAQDFDKITAQATRKHYAKGELIFAESDTADCIYFIVSGRVVIFVQKLTQKEEVGTLGPGEYFGEMAMFNKNTRSASVSALEDCTILAVEKNTFARLLETDQAFASRVKQILARRCEELAFKEGIITSTGLQGRHFQVSIKGDPSLRETAFTRERHESIVDKILPRLVPQLEELLLNRCVYEILLHFNSGEVVTTSAFDPFSTEAHPANRMIDDGYLDRHFPKLSYERKTALIQRLYRSISIDSEFDALSDQFKKRLDRSWRNWTPLTPPGIRKILARLADLRRIPDFYLRNFAISIRHDAIRMQFNCDGTHIVGSEDYLPFIEANLTVEQ